MANIKAASIPDLEERITALEEKLGEVAGLAAHAVCGCSPLRLPSTSAWSKKLGGAQPAAKSMCTSSVPVRSPIGERSLTARQAALRRAGKDVVRASTKRLPSLRMEAENDGPS